MHAHKCQLKLDLRIGEPMQICIHRNDNSPKPVNHHLTLKEAQGQNMKTSEDSQPMASYKLVSQTSRTNNKQVISTFKFGYCRLTLKEGPKVKSDNIKRFLAHDFL